MPKGKHLFHLVLTFKYTNAPAPSPKENIIEDACVVVFKCCRCIFNFCFMFLVVNKSLG